MQLYTCLPFFLKHSSHTRGNRLLWRNMNILQGIHTTHLSMVTEHWYHHHINGLLQKWPSQPEHCGIHLVCIMGINRLESSCWRGQWGPDTREAKLESTLFLGSILGCTDKGKCTLIVQDYSGALQPNICSGAFLKEPDYLEFLLQQEGFAWLLKAFETTCRQPAPQCN